MKIRAKHSKIFLGIILSILFVLNFTITAAAGVNGAEEL